MLAGRASSMFARSCKRDIANISVYSRQLNPLLTEPTARDVISHESVTNAHVQQTQKICDLLFWPHHILSLFHSSLQLLLTFCNVQQIKPYSTGLSCSLWCLLTYSCRAWLLGMRAEFVIGGHTAHTIHAYFYTMCWTICTGELAGKPLV